MTAVIIRRTTGMEEAAVITSALQAGGYSPSISNFHHAVNNWLLVPALGGVHIYLPAQEYESAKAYLRELHASAAKTLEAEFGPADMKPLKSRRIRGMLTLILLSTHIAVLYLIFRGALSLKQRLLPSQKKGLPQ